VNFETAESLGAALAAVAAGARPIAGGTDLVVGARHGAKPLPDSVVAIDRIAELRGIEIAEGSVRIGAIVTHAELMTSEVVVDTLSGVADAAALVGSPSTRNVGTLGGNVMNASPAMDTGAPLLVLGARVELRSATRTRTIGLDELWSRPGVTTAATDELCVAIVVPTPAPRSGSAYIRLEYRRAMEIAVVGAAASVTLNDDGTVATGRVALSAVAPTIIEVVGLDLAGLEVDTAAERAAEAARDVATPISDLRAGDSYRRHTVGVMAARAVHAAARRAAGEHIAVPVNRSLGIGASR
jgi:aerobic carbon-monoxide dehydrogenase medium subunit